MNCNCEFHLGCGMTGQSKGNKIMEQQRGFKANAAKVGSLGRDDLQSLVISMTSR